MAPFTGELKDYFDMLPVHVQESIMQSGVSFKTLGELQEFTKNLLSRE